MLDNFRKIYDQEIDKCCSGDAFFEFVLSNINVKMFVYEVCKMCITQEIAAKARTSTSPKGGVTGCAQTGL